MTTTTANYGWTKPDVGASNDAWGGMLNGDLDGIDSVMASKAPLASPALTGTPTAPTVATTDNSTSLATTAWVRSYSGTTTAGFLPTTGGTLTGALTVAPSAANVTLTLNKASGFGANIWGQQAGSNRWLLQLGNSTTEGGGNAGSDLALAAYDNTGTLLGAYVAITRATGNSTFYSPTFNIQPGAGLATLNLVSANNSAYLNLQKGASGQLSLIKGTNGGTLRWQVVPGDSTAESGSNNGSDFYIQSFADGGAGLANPLWIKRSTGVVTFSQAIVNGSDARWKENVRPIDDGLDLVKRLQGVRYTLKGGGGEDHVGLIAQDVEPVVPEVVIKGGDALMYGETYPDAYGLSYPQLVAVLIEAIKTLAAKVEALEAAGGTHGG